MVIAAHLRPNPIGTGLSKPERDDILPSNQQSQMAKDIDEMHADFNRVFIRQRSETTTQNSPVKFCLFPERGLPFHHNPPVTLQSISPANPIFLTLFQ